MTKNQIAISSLAMDLKRVALAYQTGSTKTAERFTEEALARKKEITGVKPYLKKHLNDLPEALGNPDKEKVAEDALMYSTIFQNSVIAS
jgi:hypothetical protein